jgi:hypothetical protein
MSNTVKSLIVYGSPTKLSNAHKPVHTASQPPKGGEKQPEYYVRIKVFNGPIEAALFSATPQPGETLLNTVPIP